MIRRGNRVILKQMAGREETDIPAKAILDENPDCGVLLAVPCPPDIGAPWLAVYVQSDRIAVCDPERWEAQLEALNGEAAEPVKKK